MISNIVGNTLTKSAIYIKIGPRRVRSRVVVQPDKLEQKPIPMVLKRGKSKVSECSGENEATLSKIRKPAHLLSPWNPRTNHPKRRENVPTSPSTAAPDEAGATVANGHHGGSGEIFRQKSDLNPATRAEVASPMMSVRSDEDEETPTASASLHPRRSARSSSASATWWNVTIT